MEVKHEGEKAVMKAVCTNPRPKRGKRNVFCPFYGDCLDTAIQKGWSHWCCSQCGQQSNREGEPELELTVNHSIAYFEIGHKGLSNI